jgi:hypothetical protein
VLLVRLQLTNPDGAGASNLVLKRLRVDIQNRAGKSVPPNTALKTLRVVSRIGSGSVAATATNPLDVPIVPSAGIAPDKPDTMAIFADLAENTALKNFGWSLTTAMILSPKIRMAAAALWRRPLMVARQ